MHKPIYLSDKKKFIMKLKIEEYYNRVPSILMNGIIKKFQNAFDVYVNIKTLDKEAKGGMITSAESVICSLEVKLVAKKRNLKFEK
jgi:hypothetical protein